MRTYRKPITGINDGADLPADFLEGIYTRITAEGFKVKEDDGAPEPGTPGADSSKVSSHDKYRAEVCVSAKRDLFLWQKRPPNTRAYLRYA